MRSVRDVTVDQDNEIIYCCHESKEPESFLRSIVSKVREDVCDRLKLEEENLVTLGSYIRTDRLEGTEYLLYLNF